MLEVLVLKNAAECTSQRLKWTSGASVMIIVLPDCESSIGVLVFHGVPLPPPLPRPLPPLVQKCAVGIQYKIDKSQGHLLSGRGLKVSIDNGTVFGTRITLAII